MSIDRAVIFDLDDTLYPERMYVQGGLAAAAEAVSHHFGNTHEILTRLMQLFDSEHRFRVIDAFLDEHSLQDRDEWRPIMLRAYRGHNPQVSLFPDADAALSRLRATHRIGLITDGRAESQRAKIEALGLRMRLDEIIITSELGEGYAKPHARAFEMMMERLKVEPARCAYVADNPSKDFVAPAALGWRTIRVRREDGLYRDAPAAPGGEPQAVISSLHELDRHLAW